MLMRSCRHWFGRAVVGRGIRTIALTDVSRLYGVEARLHITR